MIPQVTARWGSPQIFFWSLKRRRLLQGNVIRNSVTSVTFFDRFSAYNASYVHVSRIQHLVCFSLANSTCFFLSRAGAGMAQWWKRSSPTFVAWVRFWPSVTCRLSLLLVLALLWGYFSGFSGFLPSAKPRAFKFQFHQVRGPAWKAAKTDVASSLNIIVFLMYKGRLLAQREL